MKKTVPISIIFSISLCLVSCNRTENTANLQKNNAQGYTSFLELRDSNTLPYEESEEVVDKPVSIDDEQISVHEYNYKAEEKMPSSTQEQLASNGLMAGASPNTSALAFYYYTDKTAYYSYIYDGETIQNILNELDAVNAIKVENWSLDEITMPIYGVWIGSTDGSSIFAAWSNGHWISQDGVVYSFDYDFEKLEQDYHWADKRDYSSFTGFPCARLLSQNESGWNTRLLTPATELKEPDGVKMTLESWDNDTVSVKITNNSGADWMYGEYYNLQVLLNDEWYEIPTTPGQWGFNDIGLIIQNGDEQNKIYNLAMYGKLPTGTYRLVAYGLSIENTVP